jgi:release factor glutamine methyltransferase
MPLEQGMPNDDGADMVGVHGENAALERMVSFMGVDLLVNQDVLAPREETELLGQTVLALLRDREGDQTVIDMCCGCGNLSLAIAARANATRIWASDLTDATVAVARANAARLGLGHRVNIVQGDLFAGLDGSDLAGKVDLVMCNPPYISTARLGGDRAHLLEAEPREAFDGGPYGISIMQRLVSEALPFLKEGGWLAFEFGAGQERQAKLLLERTKRYEDISFADDAAGVPRVAQARKKAAA